MYALVFGTKTFYPYLVNKQFVARLDHRSLVWLQNFKDPKPQEARWIQHLQQYDMKIEHRPGHLHGNADGLSRRPWPDLIESVKQKTTPYHPQCDGGVRNDLSVRLPVLLPRLRRSKRSGISISLRSSWLCVHPPMRRPASPPVCSCSAGN